MLVLINGAPGSGKSTLAQRYAEQHPLTLALDVDVLRSMVGGWSEQPAEAGRIARRIALAAARVHLTDGRDVLVPQFLGRVEFLLELEDLCRQTGSDFIEVALLSDPEDVVERFARRSAEAATAMHRDARDLLQRSGGLEELPAMYARLLDVIGRRPRTRTVVTVDGRVEQAYRDLLAQLDQGRADGS